MRKIRQRILSGLLSLVLVCSSLIGTNVQDVHAREIIELMAFEGNIAGTAGVPIEPAEVTYTINNEKFQPFKAHF